MSKDINKLKESKIYWWTLTCIYKPETYKKKIQRKQNILINTYMYLKPEMYITQTYKHEKSSTYPVNKTKVNNHFYAYLN